MATVLVRSHRDTSTEGGLTAGLHTLDLTELQNYEDFFDSGDMTFHLPINQWNGLNQELNDQLYDLYRLFGKQQLSPVAWADFYDNAPTTGTTLETLYGYTVAAGTFKRDGDKLHIRFAGDFASNGNNKELRFGLFGTTLISTGTITPNNLDWHIDCFVIRRSNTEVRAHGQLLYGTTVQAASVLELTGLDLDNTDYTILMRGATSAAAGDLTARHGSIIYTPAVQDLDSPSAPVLDPVTVDSAAQITLDWSAIADAAGYEVQYKESASDVWISPADVGNVITYPVTGLDASTPYNFRVRAYDAAGNHGKWSNIQNGVTDEPIAWTPADLTQAIARYKWSEMVGFNDNDPVGTFVDTIGAFDATSSGSNRPTYKSAGYVSFDGSDDYLDTGITNTFGDFAVFLVFRMFNMTEGTSRIVDKHYANGFWVGTDSTGDGDLGGGVQQGSSPYGDFYTASASTWYAMLFQRSGTTKTIRFAGNSNTAGVGSGALGSEQIRLGAETGTGVTFGQFDLKEMVVCNDDIAGDDLTNLIDYALAEYGLTL